MARRRTNLQASKVLFPFITQNIVPFGLTMERKTPNLFKRHQRGKFSAISKHFLDERDKMWGSFTLLKL